MLDAYSEIDAPTREKAAVEVLVEVQKIIPGEHLELCKTIVNAMPSLGSYSGWHVWFKQHAVAKVLNQLRPPKN